MKTTTEPKTTNESIHNPEEEMALLKAVAEGDRDKFQDLHKRFVGIVYSTVYKVLNDSEDTEDVVQEVFTAIWKKAGMYEPNKGKPMTWITTMARNRAIDRLRSKQRRYKLSEDFKTEREVLTSGSKVDSSSKMELKDRHELLRTAVMELSGAQRKAIQLAYFSGLTQAEIAEQLGEPLGTVKARIRRGIIRLRTVVPQRL